MAKMMRISIFMDLLPLKLYGKEGRPQSPNIMAAGIPRHKSAKAPKRGIDFQPRAV